MSVNLSLETERGDLLSKETRKHRRTLLQTKRANSCRVPSKNYQTRISFKPLTTEEVLLNWVQELPCARAEELQQRDQQLLQEQLLQQNVELREAHQRSLTEMEELRKFQSSTIRHYCKTKIGRGSEHNLGTFWPNTGIAE